MTLIDIAYTHHVVKTCRNLRMPQLFCGVAIAEGGGYASSERCRSCDYPSRWAAETRTPGPCCGWRVAEFVFVFSETGSCLLFRVVNRGVEEQWSRRRCSSEARYTWAT